MSQRTQTASLVIMALLCLGMFILTWVSLADARKLNHDVLAQLQDLANRPAPQPVVAPIDSRPSEWNQLIIQCRWNREDGLPAEGVQVQLEGVSENTAGIPSGTEVSDAGGIVDLGQVLYGTYRIYVTTPNHFSWYQEVAVRPGQDRTITLVCPKADGLGTVWLTPRFDWDSVPEPLRGRVWIHCAIQQSGGHQSEWSVDSRNYEWPPHLQSYGEKYASESGFDPTIVSFLFNESGQMIPADGLEADGRASTVSSEESQLLRVTWNWYQLPENPEPVESMELPTGRYAIGSSVLIADPADASGRRLLKMTLHLEDEHSGVDASLIRSAIENMSPVPVRMQLGNVPLSYLAPAMPWATELRRDPTQGRTDPPHLVHWDTPAAWEFPVASEPQFFLAELALRVPLGMEIAPVTIYTHMDDPREPLPTSSVDVVWKGLVVDEAGNVTAEEHVLLTGLDLIASGTTDLQDGAYCEPHYMPLTDDEAIALSDDAIAIGLILQPSAEPVRLSTEQTLNAELLARLKSEAVQLGAFWAYPNEFPSNMKAVWMEAPKQGNGVDLSEIMDNGSICDVYLDNAARPPEGEGIGLVDKLLLSNRVVFQAVDPNGERSPSYTVRVIVTAEEAELLSLANSVGKLIALPFDVNGGSDIHPLKSNPHLNDLLDELESLETRSTDP